MSGESARRALRTAVVLTLALGCTACTARPLDASDDVGAPRLVAVPVPRAPLVDGRADDPAWAAAAALVVNARPVDSADTRPPVPVTLRAVHTADFVLHLLVTWPDAAPDETHKTWVWNADRGAYEAGADREDMLAVAFQLAGPFTADMLAPVEAVWDVWHWTAARTNPGGHAMDKTHVYSREEPDGNARRHTTRASSPLWIARPEDGGDSVERTVPAPTRYAGERVARYAPGEPTGSAMNVQAKGVWRTGRWTLELARALRTGHDEEDTQFAVGHAYLMAVAPFDRTDAMTVASGPIELVLAAEARRYGFELESPGHAPNGFTPGRTGKGAPGVWRVRADAGTASGALVVQQTDSDSTNYRFPLLVADSFVARDIDASVRFKPIGGRIDQAAGLVWRYQDESHYYVVRANALENNVVAYKVENGRRSDLPVLGRGRSYGVEAPVDANRWSTLRVSARGPRADVYLNGERLFGVRDTTFLQAGRVGLWTKADSVTAFDDLQLVALDSVKGGSPPTQD